MLDSGTYSNLQSFKNHYGFLLKGLDPIVQAPDGAWVKPTAIGQVKVLRDVESERRTLKAYLSGLSQAGEQVSFPEGRSISYWNFLQDLADTLPPMTDRCRISINVPMMNEERIVERFLTDYLKQKDLKLGECELVIFISGPIGYKRDSTCELAHSIAKASAGDPFPIHVVNLELPGLWSNVGAARKFLFDLTALRSVRRTNQNECLYIQMEDADNFNFDPSLIRRKIDCFDSMPHLDAIKHVLHRDPITVGRHDLLLLERTIVFLTECCFFRQNSDLIDWSVPIGSNLTLGHSWLKVVTSGSDTAISAEALALIGGFECLPRSEDLVLGDKITILRSSPMNQSIVLNPMTLGTIAQTSWSDARRNLRSLLIAVRRGSFHFIQYQDFAEESSIREVRAIDPDKIFNLPEVKAIEKFSNLEATQVQALTDDILGYFEEAFTYLIPNKLQEGLSRYAHFLSQQLLEDPNGFAVLNGRLHLKNPTALCHALNSGLTPRGDRFNQHPPQAFRQCA